MITSFGGRPARQALHLVLLSLLLLGGVLFATPVAADTNDGEDTHAGIVIQFDDGSLGEYCVDLGDDGTATGEEVLRATGLDVTVEYQSMGAAICKIENDGCNFPAQDCFCECTMLPGEPCTYWAYHRLQGNAWVQSPMGASSINVTGGSVEGWSWGSGSVSQGTAPPVRTFDQLCEAIMVTATPTTAPPTATPTATATVQPTNTATATTRPSATPTLAPSNTPAATGTLLPTVTTAGLPSATVAPSATNVALPTNTSVLPSATRALTNTPLPLATATARVNEASPTASVEVASPTVEASATPLPTATATIANTVLPTLAPPVVNAPTPTVAGIAVQPTLGAIATAAPPLVADTDSGNGSDLWIYAVFGLVVVGLLGVIGFVWYQRR